MPCGEAVQKAEGGELGSCTLQRGCAVRTPPR